MTTVLDLIDRLTRGLMIVAAFCAFGLAFLILTDVVARNLEITFYGTAEYVRNTIIVIVFLQLPYTVRIRAMLTVDIFVGALPHRWRAPIALLGNVLGLMFFAAVAAGAFHPAVEAWVTNEFEGEGAVRVAAWPARSAVVFGCSLAAFYYLIRILSPMLERRSA